MVIKKTANRSTPASRRGAENTENTSFVGVNLWRRIEVFPSAIIRG